MAQRTTSKAAPSQIKPAALRTFHARLARWYEAHGRHDLPWRQTSDPYHIWLSEVMLQQTQVGTVRDRFYFPFLAKFPTVEALAGAPRETVMKAWEGLGYYSRARNLHEAAKRVESRESSVLSKYVHKESTVKDERRCKTATTPSLTTHDSRLTTLLSLPGIGKNTAHAILAFAYHQPVAILEANVKRVVARIFALETPSDAELWAGAEMLLNRSAPFHYNQAMMDTGSLICTPKHPNCSACPARSMCLGKDSPASFPTPKAKKQVPTRHVIIHVREDEKGRFFLERRQEKLLGGLYGFAQIPYLPRPHPKFSKKKISTSPERRGAQAAPQVEPLASGEGDPSKAREAIPKTIPSQKLTSGFLGEGVALGQVTHIYSHFKLIGTVVHEAIRAKPNSTDWYTPEQIRALPLSKLDQKVLALVENCHSTA